MKSEDGGYCVRRRRELCVDGYGVGSEVGVCVGCLRCCGGAGCWWVFVLLFFTDGLSSGMLTRCCAEGLWCGVVLGGCAEGLC